LPARYAAQIEKSELEFGDEEELESKLEELLAAVLTDVDACRHNCAPTARAVACHCTPVSTPCIVDL
jgi:hypothetical protein